jgi:hypothetical protein
MRGALVLLLAMVVISAAEANQGDLLAFHEPIGRILICPDTSGSLDVEEYQAVVGEIADMLPALVFTLGVREIALLPWAGSFDVWRSPTCVAVLPTPREVVAGPVEMTEAGRIFQLVRARNEARQREEDARSTATASAAYRKAVGDSLAPLVRKLRGLRQARADCTDLHGLFQRLAMENSVTLAIVVSDGAQTCHVDRRENAVIKAPGAATVLVLVPPSNPSTASSGPPGPAEWVESRAPWVRVVPSFRINARDWSWLPVTMPGSGKSHGDSPMPGQGGR